MCTRVPPLSCITNAKLNVLTRSGDSKITRLKPCIPVNGFTSTKELVKHGESYRLSCNDGFVLYDVFQQNFLRDHVVVRNMLGNCIYDNHPVTNLMCEDARCKAPKVQNGKLVAEGFLNTCKYDYKENYMEHGSKVFIKCNDEYELFNETSGLLLKSNIISIACELTKILPDIIPRCIIHMQTPKKESSDAFLPNSNQTAEKDQQCHGRVLLTKNCRPLPLVLLYQAMAEIKPMRTRKTEAVLWSIQNTSPTGI
ncbi:hypothetical protein DPMN_098733 [Dreissena polymorpha]|uniref:Uncharacterized protein n=1 Tax=Dreissena polymorpha TaxID=45954 RepID=A0A9D4R6L7_DREPO|nr:hypothetical protein DPMN_098733 [Dreissena polymorpha]